MTRTPLAVIAGAAALALTAQGAAAACSAGKPAADLTAAEAQAVYDCLAADMHAGYNKGSKRWIPASHVSDYRNGKLANVAPAAPGFHGDRFLMTWVNDVGHAEYVRYADERGPMPAGTLIAKESFSVNDKGEARAGPLFIMEKVAAGTSPESNDWHYMMVAPNGVPQAVPVMQACHACHAGFEGSDGLGYPVEEVRLGN